MILLSDIVSPLVGLLHARDTFQQAAKPYKRVGRPDPLGAAHGRLVSPLSTTERVATATVVPYEAEEPDVIYGRSEKLPLTRRENYDRLMYVDTT
jgi:hypothetical protein